MPLLFAGGLDAFDENGSLIDDGATFQNIVFDVLWAALSSQVFIIVMARPTRDCSNYNDILKQKKKGNLDEI